MEIKDNKDMAKFLREVIAGTDDDFIFEYTDNIDIGKCLINTFTVTDSVTNKTYLVSVKAVK